MRLLNIVHLYVVRLKARAAFVQEAFAVVGIAIGAALLFAAQIASTSLDGSVAQLSRGVVGKAQYQLEARSSSGFSEHLLGKVQRLRGVSAAMPVLDRQIVILGPNGSENVDLIAGDPRAARLAGPLLNHFTATQLEHGKALAVPDPIANAIGSGPLEAVKVEIGGQIHRALIAATLSESSVGSLADSPVVLSPLTYAQNLAGMPGRITRIFVRARAGHASEVRRALGRVAGGRLNVEPADFDAKLFAQAAAPINQSTTTFAIICAVVGFMFAYCSMLLTVELRRAFVRELRRSGATRSATIGALTFDALVLGTVASVLGIALGDLLSLLLFSAKPGYLTFAFPVGSQRIVTWEGAVVSGAAAMGAASVGVLTPIRDVWSHTKGRNRPPAARRARSRAPLAALAAGLACVAGTTVILILAPRLAILGAFVLMAALVLLLPFLADVAIAAFDAVQRRVGSASTEVAVAELRSSKTRTRSMAIAATGAIAVFGSVSIQGAHLNLQRGLNGLVRQLSAASDVWVLAPGEQNTLATTQLNAHVGHLLAHLPGVRAVGNYKAGFLEYGDRRVWALAPPSTATWPVPPGQIEAGGLLRATRRLRAGGWALVSEALAAERHLYVGQRFTLPTVRPLTVRLAGTITNLGWPPGAVILNEADFARGWQSVAPTAYNVMLKSWASQKAVSKEIRSALGPATALSVQTERQREQTQLSVSHQGLGRLTQIAMLMLLAGVLATVSLMGAAISQRRRRFARMKVHGLTTGTLWAALVWESALLLGTGCLAGAAFGVYGQVLLSHALRTVTGFPVIISSAAPLALGSFALVTAVAAAMICVRGYRVAAVEPYPYSHT